MAITSRERLLRTLRREPVDRVPISTYELVGWNPDSFENKAPSYRRLMDRIRADTDCIYMWGWSPWAPSPLWECREETTSAGMRMQYFRLRTPRGDLTRTFKVVPGVHTTWQIEHLLKTPEDVDAYLSVLPSLYQFDAARVDRAKEDYARTRERLGDRGIIMGSDGDPSGYVPDLFSFEDFLLFCFQYPDKIFELIEAIKPFCFEKFRLDVENGFGDLVRLWGPEYYTPPYLPASFFVDMVVPYLAESVRILQDGGIPVRVHCHGRVRDALPHIVAMNAVGIDPLEPPPDGDISLAEVKERYGDDLVLFGNTELKLLEQGTPEQVRQCVREQMAAAKEGGGYVLMPTAAPINEPLSPQTEQNYFAWIDAGLEYGTY